MTLHNLVPRASFPLTSGRKTRALGTTISGMRHRCRCAVSRIIRIRLFPLFFHNGCSQSSRFPTAGQGERSSGNEIELCMNPDLDGITHEQTIICRQLFAGHLVDSRLMKGRKNELMISNGNSWVSRDVTSFAQVSVRHVGVPRVSNYANNRPFLQ